MSTYKFKLGAGDLILNSPFEEPKHYWKYDRKYGGGFFKCDGRRPAGYVVASPDAQGFDDPGRFIPLELVNRIRPLVQAWRDANYPDVTSVTRKLLEHWRDPDQREARRFFFCQLEAIETLVWLRECNSTVPSPRYSGQISPDSFTPSPVPRVEGRGEGLKRVPAPPPHPNPLPGVPGRGNRDYEDKPSPQSTAEGNSIHIPTDGGPFSRCCAKMATGSGKTIVMAMVIAWQVLNKVASPDDPRFSKHVLVVAPGLTVRNRLQVLKPDEPGNYYDEFDIVPANEDYQKLRQGKVLIHNWHSLQWDSEEQLARRRSVDKRGAMSDEAYVRDVLGDMAMARDLLVINDEAHHAWRVYAESQAVGVAREELDEATKWIGGLDRIHAARGILQCFDFSATPYIPSGKKSSDEALFSWIVSDFGLNDAIEAGLVKTPRVVVRDNGKLTAEYKSRFYHLYRDSTVTDDFNRKAEPYEPLPDLVTQAYTLLGQDWLETAKDWRGSGHPVPPVLITVCNRTETAARIKHAFDEGKIHIEELCNPDKTLHIDSKVLGQAEAQEQAVALDESEPDDEESDDAPVNKLTKQQQAELLRRMVDTVGRQGQPGEQIQNVISVGMLSEGWDAKTVTHIMGLRAFTSQLLCEQVVGRGLRRTTYDLNQETGLFDAEYVNIFGVPFTFLPHEEGGEVAPPPPKPVTIVQVLPQREQEFGISWPNIIRIEHFYRPELQLDVQRMRVLPLSARDTPTYAELAPVLEGKPNMEALSEIDLQEFGRKHRLQTIVFKAARDVFEQMQPTWQGTREALLGQAIQLVDKVLRSDRISFEPALFETDDLRRRVLLMLNMNKVVQHVFEAIRFENTSRLEPVFDVERPIRSTADMRTWSTTRPNHLTTKSHVNVAVYDSRWEASESFFLERSNLVEAWVKNDHLGFEVLWMFGGVVRKYRPDFLIRLHNGTTLVLEVKGQDSQENQAKRCFLAEWVQAVNENGEFGRWVSDVSFDPDDIEGILSRHSNAAVIS